MLPLLLVAILGQAAGNDGRFDRFCRSSSRSTRGLPCDSYAFFEFAPLSGAGMGAPCSGASITGAKGEVVTLTRASAGTCTKGSDQAITPGDVVKLTNNQPIVGNPNGAGLALLVEGTGTNSAIRSEELCNIAHTNTVTCTTDTTVAPDGTTTAETLNDTSAVAIQCSTQVIAIATQAAYTASAYLLGGTATIATVSLVGTGNSAGDCSTTYGSLSTTTWLRGSCSGAAYGVGLTAVTVKICVGTAAATTGTVFAWGEDVKASAAYVTSYIPTTTIAAARATTTAIIAPAWPTSSKVSIAGTFLGPTPANGSAATMLVNTGLAFLYNESAGTMRFYTAPSAIIFTMASSTAGIRWYGWHDGTNRGGAWGANTATGANVNAANKFGAQVDLAGGSFGGVQPDGWTSRICVDPDPARCR